MSKLEKVLSKLEKLTPELCVIYKTCKPTAYGKDSDLELLEELSNEQKLIIAKHTKYVPSIKQWCVDWSGLGLAEAKTDVWRYIQKLVDNSDSTKPMRGKSIPKFIIDSLDKMKPEYKQYCGSEDHVQDIYKATGKIVHLDHISKNFIKKEPKEDSYSKILELIKDSNLEPKQCTQLLLALERKLPKSYAKTKYETPKELEDLGEELLEKSKRRTLISKEDVTREPAKFLFLNLAGFVPAKLEAMTNSQGDFSGYKYLEQVKEEGINKLLAFTGRMENKETVGLGYYKAARQQPFLSVNSNYTLSYTEVKNFIIKNIKDNFSIIKKYMGNPKPYYLFKKSGKFYFNFHNIALDIYYNEKVVVSPLSLECLKKKDLFNGKEPREVADEV